VETGGSVSVEYRRQTKQGDWVWICSTGKISEYDTDNTPLRMVGTPVDITEKKLAEMALRASEAQFRVLLKNVVLGIFIIKADKVVYLDPEQEILCGPLFSSFISSYFDSKDGEKIESFYKEILVSGNSKEGLELRFSPQGNATDNENMPWVHCKGSRIEYEGDAAVMIALVDVTRVKEMEKVMQLREKMVSLGQVAAGIAHEIRNPLSGINIFLEGIAENFEPPENAADIRMLIKEARKASGKIEATIKRVLDFARPSRPHMKEMDINIPVREAIELMGTTLRKWDILIESDLGESLPSLFLDALLIEQVVMNLITNAADAMKNNTAPKRIKLTTSQVQHDVFLSISDSGEGIPAAVEKKIFDPFFTTKADGSGIGLSFCQRVITDHNGTISLLPSEWGGAQFRIKLPVDKRVLSR
jgi:signal transduction histidine kinase